MILAQGYKLLRNIAGIRKYLSQDHIITLIHSLVVSKIDNCNSILYGANASEISRLQRFQNACARFIYGKKKRDHVSPLLQELHWLPIKQRIIFKILCIVFKSFHNMSPTYISELLIPIKENSTLLQIPRSNSTYGDRAFSSYAPKLWNALPLELRNICTLETFKSHVKHHLFTSFQVYISKAFMYRN